MESVIQVLTYIGSNYLVFIGLVAAVGVTFLALLRALIQIFILIPGEQPEKAMQSVVDFLQTYVDKIQSLSKK